MSRDAVVFAAPVLIVHYVEAHNYLPLPSFFRQLKKQRTTLPENGVSGKVTAKGDFTDNATFQAIHGEPPVLALSSSVNCLICSTVALGIIDCWVWIILSFTTTIHGGRSKNYLLLIPDAQRPYSPRNPGHSLKPLPAAMCQMVSFLRAFQHDRLHRPAAEWLAFRASSQAHQATG